MKITTTKRFVVSFLLLLFGILSFQSTIVFTWGHLGGLCMFAGALGLFFCYDEITIKIDAKREMIKNGCKNNKHNL